MKVKKKERLWNANLLLNNVMVVSMNVMKKRDYVFKPSKIMIEKSLKLTNVTIILFLNLTQ